VLKRVNEEDHKENSESLMKSKSFAAGERHRNWQGHCTQNLSGYSVLYLDDISKRHFFYPSAMLKSFFNLRRNFASLYYGSPQLLCNV